MPPGACQHAPAAGSRLALVAFLSVAGLVMWAAYLTFARAAEHQSVIDAFHHPHVPRNQHARTEIWDGPNRGRVRLAALVPRRDAHAGCT